MPHPIRNTMHESAGTGATRTMQCRVMDINLKNWTVDVVTVFDQKYYKGLQISSGYLHWHKGEGFYAIPEVGALCHITVPGDSAPPFVGDFVAPLEIRTDGAAPGQEEDTRSRGSTTPYVSDASFAAGRKLGKPGDILMVGRDGQFVILHRGGVLQIGSTSLSQRVYIPISNRIVDIAENYELKSIAGTMSWQILDEQSEDQTPAEFCQTFRLYAQDKYADIRVKTGKVTAPIAEQDGSETLGHIKELDMGQDDGPIVHEVVIAPGGFNSDGSAASSDTKNLTVLKYFFDRKGNFFFRTEKNVYVFVRGRTHAVFKGPVLLEGEEDLRLNFKKGVAFIGPDGVAIEGKVVSVNKGNAPVARMGDPVTLAPGIIPVSGTITPPGGPPAAFIGTLTITTPLLGAIIGGNPGFRALWLSIM